MGTNNQAEIPETIDTLLDAGRLESAQKLYDQAQLSPQRSEIDNRIEVLNKKIETQQAQGEIYHVHRFKRRLNAIESFRDYGFVPEKLIRRAVLPPDYRGKILLVIVKAENSGRWVCLRSGDDWHREILKSTVEEMADLGFENISITPVGGASVDFNNHGEMTIYGTSEEYGACDKQVVVKLIAGLYPDRKIQMQT